MRTQTTMHSLAAGARRVIPLLLAAVLVLAGCSATHVGDAWQCPVAQGTACTRVAEADPAVASSGKTQGLTLREPPMQQTENDDAEESDAGCAGGCDPFAWLAKWFNTSEESVDARAPVGSVSTSPGGEPADVSRESLRTEERIARIWIAPFVDADGVYREAHWVRTVLEPARWRRR